MADPELELASALCLINGTAFAFSIGMAGGFGTEPTETEQQEVINDLAPAIESAASIFGHVKPPTDLSTWHERHSERLDAAVTEMTRKKSVDAGERVLEALGALADDPAPEPGRSRLKARLPDTPSCAVYKDGSFRVLGLDPVEEP